MMYKAAVALSVIVTYGAVFTAAQSCNNVTTTIVTPADATAIASCKTFTGAIAFATDHPPVVQLIGVETVLGDVIVANNSQVTAIESDIQTVTGAVVLDTLPLLTNITLPMWSSTGTLIMNKIPPPNVLDMNTTVQSVTNLYITDTTLETLFGLLLQTSQMEVLQITGNKFLANCWFGVGNITKQATILDNNPEMNLTLPSLTYAYSMNVTSAAEMQMPLLQSISQNLDISGTNMESLDLPSLSFVGEELSLTNNDQLSNLSLGGLVNIQGPLTIAGNPQLDDLAGLGSLSYVGGDLTLEGDFTHAHLQNLHDVKGNLVIGSSEKFDCSEIPRSAVQGNYSCNGTNGAGGHKLSPGAIAGIVVGVVAILAVVVALFVWRRRRSRGDGIREINEPPPPLQKDDSWRAYYGHGDDKSTDGLTDGKGQGEAVATHGLGKHSVETGSIERPGQVHELPSGPFGAAFELSALASRPNSARGD